MPCFCKMRTSKVEGVSVVKPSARNQNCLLSLDILSYSLALCTDDIRLVEGVRSQI